MPSAVVTIFSCQIGIFQVLFENLIVLFKITSGKDRLCFIYFCLPAGTYCFSDREYYSVTMIIFSQLIEIRYSSRRVPRVY